MPTMRRGEECVDIAIIGKPRYVREVSTPTEKDALATSIQEMAQSLLGLELYSQLGFWYDPAARTVDIVGALKSQSPDVQLDAIEQYMDFQEIYVDEVFMTLRFVSGEEFGSYAPTLSKELVHA